MHLVIIKAVFSYVLFKWQMERQQSFKILILRHSLECLQFWDIISVSSMVIYSNEIFFIKV